MDKDLNELEQLAEGTHADLQEKPKKGANKEVNGQADDKENAIQALSAPSIDGLTGDSIATTSAATLNEAQQMSAKQPNNRATLQEQQMAQKVNQDLFYQMPDDDENGDASPEPSKETIVTKQASDTIPDVGTPLKAPKSDKDVEKEEESDKNSPLIEDVAAKVEAAQNSETIVATDAFKSLDDEFDAIDQLGDASANKDSIKKFEQSISVADTGSGAKIDCMEDLVAQVNQVEDGIESAKSDKSDKKDEKEDKEEKEEKLSPKLAGSSSPAKSEQVKTPKSRDNNTTNVSDRHHGNQFSNMEDKDFAPLRDLLDESFYEDEDSSEDEGMPDYKIGGYHPIHVGEILLDRYVIIQKLGWGHFSTVWLTKDLKFNSYVALKVQKSAQHYVEAAYDEVDILDQVAKNWRTEEWADSIGEYYKNDKHLMTRVAKYGVISESSHCAQLLNSFIHHGPNGKHFIMVFEILGVNFLEIIKRYDYKGVPLPLVRKLARQCLIGLDYIHRMCQIIHTDFKPENVVICLRDQEIGEIQKTGQLTTTKMGKNDNIKKMNMKVAGTIGNYLNQKVNSKTGELEDPHKKDKDLDTSIISKTDSEIQQVWDPKLFEGLTAKQKKNLRKKLQRQRKKKEKMDNSQADSQSLDQSESNRDTSIMDGNEMDKPMGEIDNIDIDVQDKEEKILDGLKEGQASKVTEQTVEEMKQEFKDLQSKRGRKLDQKVMVKICDMGNGCWTHHHFTPEIQTRQYRSPEVIIGADYNTSADVWSFACTIFEMITGDFLFEPRKGNNYDKDDDHLAQMMELLGRMPKNLALSGKNSRKFFDSKGHLRRISGLNFWPLKKVLVEKYRIKEDEAMALADFLIPMLTWNHETRASAQEMLRHPWLDMEPNYDFKYTEREYEVMLLKKELKNQMKGGQQQQQDPADVEDRQEMNELVDSEPELYGGDTEEMHIPKKEKGGDKKKDLLQERQKLKADIQNHLKTTDNDAPGVISTSAANDTKIMNNLFDPEEISLVDPEEEREKIKTAKELQSKIHNSFTGPYPLDPTEFSHTDKGENYQFSTLTEQLDKY